MAWCWTSDKPFAETMMGLVYWRIYVPCPQWIKFEILWTILNNIIWSEECYFKSLMVKETQQKTCLALLDHCYCHNGNLHRTSLQWIRTKVRPRQNGHHFADNIFKFILLYEKFASNFTEICSQRVQLCKKKSMVHIMVCRWTGNKSSA